MPEERKSAIPGNRPKTGLERDRSGHFSPVHLFIITVTGIILAETIASIFVFNLHQFTPLEITLIDISIMILLIFPVLYFFSFRPLLQHIEERKKIELEMKQKEELLERYFNSSNTLIAYMDREFNFIKVNKGYAGSARQKPEYFIGKNHFDLYPHPENKQIFERVVETGESYTVYKKPFVYPDQPERGVTFWNWDLQPVFEADGIVAGLVLTLVDVTEQKQAERNAEIERLRLKSILDNMPDGVYIVNQDFDIEYANPAIEKIFGPLNGEKCFKYFHDRNEVCLQCRNIPPLDEKINRWEWRSPTTDKIFEAFDTPLMNADGSYSKLKLIHDITHRKQTEMELEKRNRDLQLMSDMHQKQRMIAETLRDATDALTKTLDMDTVLKTLVSYLCKLVNPDAAGVFYKEGDSHISIRAAEGFRDGAKINLTDPSGKGKNGTAQLQKLMTVRKSLLIPDIEEELNPLKFWDGKKCRSYLLSPIFIEDKLTGLVTLGKTQANYFNHEHLQWTEALANQAAVAIHNALLFERVRDGRERLQNLSRGLVEIQETERRNIARELHDQASQVLTMLKLGLGNLEKEAEMAQSVRMRVAELKKMTDEVLEDIHRIAINLRPASLDHLGLIPALDQMIKLFSQDAKLSIKFKTIGYSEENRLPQETEITLFRIVQEALTNVIRHAGASHVDVIFERRADQLLLIIEDDGKGFDPEETKSSEQLGLFGMQERAEMLHGTLTVESIPHRGTTLVVEVPYGS